VTLDLTRIDLSALSEDEKRELYDLLKAKDTRAKRNRLAAYKPYAKQVDFHTSGHDFRERLFMAGNQLGKTWAGAYETAMHLTGQYPAWWKGKRFNYAIRAMAGSESAELTRKGVQRLLLGPPELREEWGTGAIPYAAVKDTSMKQGVADAVSSVVVRHVCGEDSVIQFNSYDQGRGKWQADTVDWVWFDEEPPLPIYSEGRTRTNATGGSVIVTFTPLLGMSDVVKRYLLEKPEGTSVTTMTIDDAEHYSPEERARIIAGYPEHEREARAKGIPTLGSGRVFPVSEDLVKCEPFAIPKHWPQICGLDFGWDHPSAAARLAWDRDADVVYVTQTHRAREQTPVLFAASVRPWGKWLPWAWPHDGLQHDKGSGEQLAAQYREQGLGLLLERATFPDGTNGLEAGVMEMLDRMQTRRWKVFSSCADWFEEFRLYHRKDGLIVKERDDLISASRYAMMMLRAAKVERRAVSDSPSASWLG